MKCTFFSLIELLIVTAIIAILAAMLLPALNKARQKAYTINCVNNFKQVGISMSFYLNDNDEMFPRYGTSEGGKNLAWSGNLARGNYLRSARSFNLSCNCGFRQISG
ncbi:MAG: type II secretion system protein [Victivallales bacterium]